MTYRPGGLLRCCVQTIEERPDEPEPSEGDVMECKWCSDSVIFRDGAWEWNRTK